MSGFLLSAHPPLRSDHDGRPRPPVVRKAPVPLRRGAQMMICEKAPPEWQIVAEENIKRFQKSVRYKRSEDKEAALEKFKITFQKQRLWNERCV